MKKGRKKRIVIFIFVLLSIFAWSTFLYFVSPKEIVDYVGIENSYWLIFLIGMLGGVSTLTSTSFYGALITFAAGGSNPFILGLVAGLAISIGDSVFYFLGKNGYAVLPQSINDFANKAKDWLENKPKALVPTIIIIYNGFTPLPGDVLSIFLGLTKQKYRFIIGFIIAGNIILMTILSVLASRGIGSIEQLFI